MSHELRTPLNAIIGYTDLLVRYRDMPGDTNEGQLLEYTEAVNTAGTHLLSLVNNLLDLSRIECGRFDLAPQSLCIDDVIENAVQSLKPHALERENTIMVNNECAGRFVEGDARAVHQILGNILANALKLSPEGEDVRLDVRDDDTGTTFIVTDRGEGMSPEDMEIAMRPFARLSEDHINSGESIGLGLSIVNALCTLHEGSLVLESEKGHGTVVRAHLPARRNDDHRSVTCPGGVPGPRERIERPGRRAISGRRGD